MLEIKGLNKFFFKGKKNQIHVINDTTLSMDDKGLVALLGPSGCGKTTLLNVIGGLDGANRGDVFINGQRITRRRSGKVDAIRSLNIGYIFQNYNLVENMTVFDNVAIALRMTGVKNEKEIEEKVCYVLEKTGMLRYRNRLAEMLSGGERQRVGIARAIVKNPEVIIADEPTGNLDSKNTIDVMNIIKTISKDKLVILVTHEENLAKFFATRIIRISDGRVVSDEAGGSEDELDYRMDYRVYLGDIEDHQRLRSNKYNIDFYSEDEAPIDLDIVIRKGSILIRNNTPGSSLEVVGDESPIELIDDNYRPFGEGNESETDFSVSKLETSSKRKYRSIVGPIRMIKMGFERVSDYGIIKKILLAGFTISALFVTYSVCSIFGILSVTDDMFVTADKSYLSVISKHTDIDQYLALEGDENIDYLMPGDSQVSLMLNYDTYLQTSSAEIMISGSLSDYGKLDKEQIIYGELPKSDDEIVLDKLTVKNAIRDMSTKEVGLSKIRDFIGCTIEADNMPEFKIVGISDLQSPCIYTDRSKFIDILACSDNEYGYVGGLIDCNLVKSKITKTGGEWPGDYEVLVNEDNKEDMRIGKTIDEKVAGKKLKVSGYYSDKRGSDDLLVSSDTLKYQLISTMPGITICPRDKQQVLADLRSREINVKDTYSRDRKEYIEQNRAYTRSSLIVAVIILAISCIEIFIIMRASFLSRIKEVGVYRAIGVKKGDIYRMFTGEILTIIVLTALPGFLFMFYVLSRLGKMSYFETSFVTTPPVAGICLGIIFAANMIFGLIPVFRTIRKRPAEILARTDIN